MCETTFPSENTYNLPYYFDMVKYPNGDSPVGSIGNRMFSVVTTPFELVSGVRTIVAARPFVPSNLQVQCFYLDIIDYHWMFQGATQAFRSVVVPSLEMEEQDLVRYTQKYGEDSDLPMYTPMPRTSDKEALLTALIGDSGVHTQNSVFEALEGLELGLNLEDAGALVSEMQSAHIFYEVSPENFFLNVPMAALWLENAQ
jgi:hypothetical protein